MELTTVRPVLEAHIKEVAAHNAAITMPPAELLNMFPHQKEVWRSQLRSTHSDAFLRAMERYEPITPPKGWHCGLVAGAMEFEGVRRAREALVAGSPLAYLPDWAKAAVKGNPAHNVAEVNVYNQPMPHAVLQRMAEARDVFADAFLVYSPDRAVFGTGFVVVDPILTGIVEGQPFFVAAWNLEEDMKFVSEEAQIRATPGPKVDYAWKLIVR